VAVEAEVVLIQTAPPVAVEAEVVLEQPQFDHILVPKLLLRHIRLVLAVLLVRPPTAPAEVMEELLHGHLQAELLFLAPVERVEPELA
jgi:hypothetical protein